MRKANQVGLKQFATVTTQATILAHPTRHFLKATLSLQTALVSLGKAISLTQKFTVRKGMVIRVRPIEAVSGLLVRISGRVDWASRSIDSAPITTRARTARSSQMVVTLAPSMELRTSTISIDSVRSNTMTTTKKKEILSLLCNESTKAQRLKLQLSRVTLRRPNSSKVTSPGSRISLKSTKLV